MRTAVAALALLTAVVPARAVDFRWATGYGMGALSAAIHNRDGSYLVISCGPDFPAGNVEVQSTRWPKLHEASGTVQFVIDGKNFPVYIKNTLFIANSRSTENDYVQLITALRATKSRSFVAEYPDIDKSETFSLLNVKGALESLKDCAP